jgi:hypothetical protein
VLHQEVRGIPITNSAPKREHVKDLLASKLNWLSKFLPYKFWAFTGSGCLRNGGQCQPFS